MEDTCTGRSYSIEADYFQTDNNELEDLSLWGGAVQLLGHLVLQILLADLRRRVIELSETVRALLGQPATALARPPKLGCASGVCLGNGGIEQRHIALQHSPSSPPNIIKNMVAIQ